MSARLGIVCSFQFRQVSLTHILTHSAPGWQSRIRQQNLTFSATGLVYYPLWAIRGLFQGHTHLAAPIKLGNEYNDLVIAQTGNFAYTKDPDVAGSFWGFRDLVIDEEGATSSYIIVESDAEIGGGLTHVDRKETHVVQYKK